MKKFFNYAMAAAVAFGLASCSKDVDYGKGGSDGDLVATFTLQTPKGAFVTYADQIAEGEEWTVNNIDVYAFTGGTMIGTGKLVKDTDYEVTSAAGAAVTTIKVKSSWLVPQAGKEVKFYFVGNDVAGASGAIDAPHVDATKTAEADFVAQITKELAVTGTTMSEVIRTPLLFSAESEVITLVGRIQAKATLIRREARFDILNKYAASAAPGNLVIDAIEISNAPRAGKIFASGAAGTINLAGIDPAMIATPVYPANYVQEADPKVAGEFTYRAKSVFYLYPTTLGTAAAETEIVIKATMGGKTDYYTRAAKKADGSDNISEINANYRYTIVLDPLSLTFDIEAADYTEGGEIETEAAGDDAFAGFVIDDSGLTAANWNAALLTYTFDGTTAETMTVTVDSKFGTVADVKYVIGAEGDITNAAALVSKTSATTYGRNIQDIYTIATPLTVAAGAFQINVTIKSPNGAAAQVISFVKGTPTAEQIEALFTCPKLAQAVTDILETTPGSTLSDITELTSSQVGGADGISSIEGLENLPNLTSISLGAAGNLPFNQNLSGFLDFSKMPQLTKIDVGGCSNVTGINVSNNPNLISLGIGITKISTVDVSNNPELVALSASYLVNMTEINLENNKKLEDFQFAGSSISTIDFDLPALKKIVMGRGINSNITGYSTIDWSGMPNLEIMQLYGSFGDKLDASTGLSHPNVKTFTYTGFTTTTPDRHRVCCLGYDLPETIDVSGFPALVEMTITTAPNLTAITGTESLASLDKMSIYPDRYIPELGVQHSVKNSFTLSPSNTLTTLSLAYSDVKNITLPAMPALTTYSSSYCHYLENLDVTGAPALQTLSVRYSDPVPLRIDVSNNQALTLIEIRNNNNVATARTFKGWAGMSTSPLPFTLNKNSLTTVTWE